MMNYHLPTPRLQFSTLEVKKKFFLWQNPFIFSFVASTLSTYLESVSLLCDVMNVYFYFSYCFYSFVFNIQNFNPMEFSLIYGMNSGFIFFLSN